MNPYWYIVIILLCCFCCFSSYVLSAAGIQGALNIAATEGTIDIVTPAKWGYCPEGWTLNEYTNGNYCINVGVMPIVDKKNNLVDAIKTTVCPYSTEVVNGVSKCVKTSN